MVWSVQSLIHCLTGFLSLLFSSPSAVIAYKPADPFPNPMKKGELRKNTNKRNHCVWDSPVAFNIRLDSIIWSISFPYFLTPCCRHIELSANIKNRFLAKIEPIINSHSGCWITQQDWAVSALDKSSPLSATGEDLLSFRSYLSAPI